VQHAVAFERVGVVDRLKARVRAAAHVGALEVPRTFPEMTKVGDVDLGADGGGEVAGEVGVVGR
jgi:hypothetical protein